MYSATAGRQRMPFNEGNRGMEFLAYLINGLGLGSVYAITNADSVRLYKNGVFINEFKPDGSRWKHLKHPPILIDDYIGDLLETEEHMPKGQAEAVKTVRRYGWRNKSSL